MYPCLLLKVLLAEYDLQLCTRSKKKLLRTCVLARLARGYTPRLHLNVVAELPRIPGVLHSGEGDQSLSGTLPTGEDNRKSNLRLDPWTAQWLATLLYRVSMAKEMMITSFKQ